MRRMSLTPAVLLVTLSVGVPQAAAQESGEYLQVVNDLDKKELILLFGPVDLPANTHHGGISSPPLQIAHIPIDAYLYGFDVQMIDRHGQPITNRVLHHVNVIDPDHRELFSPVARRLFAAGGETQPASMPRMLGVPLEKGQRLVVVGMFHNPTAESYPGAKLKLTLKYREKGWFFPVGVYPVYIDVASHMGKKDWDLPPGVSERYWEGTPGIDGRLLAAGGHLHDHATSLRFEDATTGELMWETGPTLDEEGRVVGVPVGKFWWKGGLHLKADHVYRLTVVYDNPTGSTIVDGGMGVLGGVFLPSKGEAWPELDPYDPAYVTNMENTRLAAVRRNLGMGGGHGHGHGQEMPKEPEDGQTEEHKHDHSEQ